MPQPSDSKLVAFPGTPAPARTPRDPRIDAFRGLALVMILIDHMPGNPFEEITLRNFGFSDAAEGFFVMSGVAAGIAYSSGLERWVAGQGSLWAGIAPMWRRAWTLYLVQIILTVAALGLFAWAAQTFYRHEFREMHNVGRIYDDTGSALLGLPLLGYQIGYVNILPSYILLVFAAPLAVWGALRAPGLTLAVSFALWFLAGAAQINVRIDGEAWFFSPLAWQVIFVLGLATGVRLRQGERLVPVSRPLLALAIGFLLMALCWREIPAFGAYMNNKMWQLGQLGAPSNIVTHNKTFLALPRLLHALALVYVLSCLPIVRRGAAHPAAGWLRLLGRQGLLVFSLGTILALIGQVLMDVEPGSALARWGLPPLAVLISCGAAWIADRSRSASAAARSPRAVAAAEPALPPRPLHGTGH